MSIREEGLLVDIRDELQSIRKLLERAPDVTYNVFIEGENVDQDRLQTAVDRFRK